MSTEQTELLNVYTKEYEAIRNEIILRLREKNTIVRYMILLVSAIVAGLWKVPSEQDQTFLMIVLLLIIPFISLLLTFIYNWHDEMIVTLGYYIENEIRPKINSIFEKSDLIKWDFFLREFRNKFGWKINAILRRLIFLAPIPVSIIGYFLITIRPQEKLVELILISLSLIFLIWIFRNFYAIDRKYRGLHK